MNHQRNATRDKGILRDHLAGMSMTAIGDRYGLSKTRVHEIIQAWRDECPPEERAVVVQQHVAWLEEKRAEALALWDAGPIPAYSNGKPIELPDGTVAQDHSGRLAGLKAAVDLHTRLAKMLGLDAAQKVEATVTSLEREATVAAADAAVAFLEGRDGADGDASG